MKKRIITAAVLVPILMIVLYALPKVVAAIVVSLLSAIAAYELLYRTELVKHVRLVAYSVLIAALELFFLGECNRSGSDSGFLWPAVYGDDDLPDEASDRKGRSLHFRRTVCAISVFQSDSCFDSGRWQICDFDSLCAGIPFGYRCVLYWLPVWQA